MLWVCWVTQVLTSHLRFGSAAQGAALNLTAETGAAAIAFAKARRDEGPSALLKEIDKEDSSGTFRKIYDRIKVSTPTRHLMVIWSAQATEFACVTHTCSAAPSLKYAVCCGTLQGVIDGGSLVQQGTVITFLRITPLVPFR